MLQHLYIKNYALIESLEIDFHEGFSTITGETGAGKSIILGALGLLLGDRADTKAIKQGCSKCIIEATFQIKDYPLQNFFQENDLEYDAEECIIRREIQDSGKSRAFINDSPVSLSQLKILGNELVDIHSQHQNLLLNDKRFQLSVLDIVAQNQPLLTRYADSYHQYHEAQKQLTHFEQQLQNKQDNNDYLLFQFNEINRAALQDGEQEELEEEEKILDNAGDIKETLYQTNYLLTNDETGICSKLNESVRLLESLAGIFPKTEPLAERLRSCSIEIDDIQGEIDNSLNTINFDAERQQYVSERLDTINTLESKYHKSSIQELLQMANQLKSEIEVFNNADATHESLINKRDTLLKEASALASQLSQQRKKVIPEVENSITQQLTALGMNNVQFKIQQEEQNGLTPMGLDAVTFLFSANKDVTPQNLANIGSGGEIARVMLALKAILSQGSQMRTLIFDEIDTGVSGQIAEKMALVMKQISRPGNQVISITHLPQIAALGEHHYMVYKEDTADATLTHIKLLSAEERVTTIAHMLSGTTLTEAAINNAKALLNN